MFFYHPVTVGHLPSLASQGKKGVQKDTQAQNMCIYIPQNHRVIELEEITRSSQPPAVLESFAQQGA